MKEMIKVKTGIILLSVFLLGGFASESCKAQGAIDLRINEILLYNDSNFVDDYGKHGAWIEVFNTAYSTIDLGGLYLTNDLKEPRKYRIPKGNVNTLVAPRSYYIFWADDQADKGINHLNFTIKENQLIALFDANGRTLIDSITIISNQIPDISYGRISDGNKQWTVLEKTSPLTSNSVEQKVSGSELFGKVDPTGVGMMVISMGVVFSALALLFFILRFMARILNREKKKPKKRENIEVADLVEDEISGEVNAAIAMALYMYKNQMHDYENTVLTINKVSRTYSPWSSKIYGLRRNPR